MGKAVTGTAYALSLSVGIEQERSGQGPQGGEQVADE